MRAKEEVSVPEHDPIDELPTTCPQCGATLCFGYGLMGGGMGPYVSCPGDDCYFFKKNQDKDNGQSAL